MNDTEQLFIAAAVWALIAGAIARRIPNWPGRIAFFAVAVGLPFWELPYGYYNFQKLCREEGALRIFEPVTSQKSICVDYPFETAAVGMLKKGFESVEARDKDGSVKKYARGAQGNLETVSAKRVVSDICVTRAFIRDLPWRAMRSELTAVRNSDKHLIARHSDFTWFGMWWQEAALPVLGRGGECRNGGFDSIAALLIGGSR